tara:strand:- start:1000 stop:1269 length:270 start_codon:yes stop_codon:yes gene_type:complete
MHKISDDIFWGIVNGESDMAHGFNEKQKKKLNKYLEKVNNSEVLHIIDLTPKKMKVIIQSNMETIHFWLWKKISLEMCCGDGEECSRCE